MKSRLLFAVLLAVAVMMTASTAFAAPSAAQGATPFKGTIQAVETHVVAFPTLYVNLNGSGHATHLGRYTVSNQSVVDLLTFAGTGTAHIVAANGDSIFADVVGQGVTSGPDFFSIVEKYTITGGTGRFAGATGSFTVERLLSAITGVSSGTFEGTIVLPHGK